MLDFESGGLGLIPGRGKIWFGFFLLSYYIWWPVWGAALEPDGRSKCWVVTRSLRDICIGMNAYKCLVIGRRDVAVTRYMIHFYCLAVEAGFYSDVVECSTLNPVDRVRSPVGEKCDLDFFSFLLHIFHRCLFLASNTAASDMHIRSSALMLLPCLGQYLLNG